jgi:hypothetical protein
MGLSDWVSRTRQRFKNDSTYKVLAESGYELYAGSWRLGKLLPIPTTNIYERDWDVLVLLDGCRVDVMEEVSSEYSFINNVDSISSVGSMSIEWMKNTFHSNKYESQIEETTYVTANVFSEEYIADESLDHVDEVWRYGWDEDLNTISPRSVTDSAIQINREEQPEQLIIHYMQPHHPFIADEEMSRFDVDPFGRENTGENEHITAWDAVRRGLVSRQKVWNAYKDNLRLVLEEVNILRNNMDADNFVISADHGNAVGEWGIYDHPIGFPHPSVKRVPWVETTASDSESYIPENTNKNKSTTGIESRLKALGYR